MRHGMRRSAAERFGRRNREIGPVEPRVAVGPGSPCAALRLLIRLQMGSAKAAHRRNDGLYLLPLLVHLRISVPSRLAWPRAAPPWWRRRRLRRIRVHRLPRRRIGIGIGGRAVGIGGRAVGLRRSLLAQRTHLRAEEQAVATAATWATAGRCKWDSEVWDCFTQ